MEVCEGPAGSFLPFNMTSLTNTEIRGFYFYIHKCVCVCVRVFVCMRGSFKRASWGRRKGQLGLAVCACGGAFRTVASSCWVVLQTGPSSSWRWFPRPRSDSPGQLEGDRCKKKKKCAQLHLSNFFFLNHINNIKTVQVRSVMKSLCVYCPNSSGYKPFLASSSSSSQSFPLSSSLPMDAL